MGGPPSGEKLRPMCPYNGSKETKDGIGCDTKTAAAPLHS